MKAFCAGAQISLDQLLEAAVLEKLQRSGKDGGWCQQAMADLMEQQGRPSLNQAILGTKLQAEFAGLAQRAGLMPCDFLTVVLYRRLVAVGDRISAAWVRREAKAVISIRKTERRAA